MPENETRPRINGSVFAKLVALMLAMAVTLLLLVAAFFGLIVYPSVRSTTERLTEGYAQSLAAGSLNFEAAKSLTRRLDVQVRYEGPGGNWSTSDSLPTVDEVRGGKVKHAFPSEEYDLVTAPNGGVYLFDWDSGRRTRAVHTKSLWLLLLLMVIVVFTAYAVQRHMLRSVRWLNDGVARLGTGHLDVVLPVLTNDEFGALTDAFNRMVRRVREMLHARDQLLLDVSHELRSPLTRMKVALELLPDNEHRADLACDLSEMEMMISELLELERLRDGRRIKLERRDLVPILREESDRYQRRSPGVRLAATPMHIFLDMDGEMMHVVLRNLLENAIKYSLPDSHAVEISAVENGESVIVRIRDHGLGIPDADVVNVFEPFFRVDRSRSKKTGGYGLGLSICKRIVEAHGGVISVARESPRGTSFTLTLKKCLKEPATD
jgi:signal transduction histidine kinase